MTSVGAVKLDTKRLDQIVRNLDGNTERAIKRIAFQVEGYAKTLAPVDTGALRNSINTERIDKDTYWVGDGVEYGIYQEFGTYRMAAHPFLIPAAERVSRQMGLVFRQELFR
jgi:HK97 gp10 family phage protein